MEGGMKGRDKESEWRKEREEETRRVNGGGRRKGQGE